MRTNTALTLYTRGMTSSKTESWTRSVISKVHWENRKAANVIASGLLEADSVSVWIPTQGLTISVKAGDVIVKGTVSDAVNATTFTMTDLRKKYADVATVHSVDRYDFGSGSMHHLRLGAS